MQSKIKCNGFQIDCFCDCLRHPAKCKKDDELSKNKNINILGKPRPPIFSSEMREILTGVRTVNISWSCDSQELVSQYQLLYRHNKVSPERAVCVCVTRKIKTYIMISTQNDLDIHNSMNSILILDVNVGEHSS